MKLRILAKGYRIFIESDKSKPEELTATDLRYYGIAVPVPLFGLFTYASQKEILLGCRVLVGFGRRQLTGVVVENLQALPDSSSKIKIREIINIIDDNPSYDSEILALAAWAADYYCYPIGEVLRTMLPGGKSGDGSFILKLNQSSASKGRFSEIDETGSLRRELECLFGSKKRTTIGYKAACEKLRKAEPQLQLEDYQRKIENLINLDLISEVIKDPSQGKYFATAGLQDKNQSPEKPRLNNQQQLVVDEICKGIFSLEKANRIPVLLHGITGSGKTEVYLNIIEKILNEDLDSQALVLVPEISLTPQMTRVFEQRFSGQVVIVHSAQKKSMRAQNLETVKLGKARILIGPRSSVFASFRKLSVVVVDEEHDGSYKQTTGLCYNGRDLAVVRGAQADVQVILGSATPSIESFTNARLGKYRLLELPNRIARGGLPTVKMIDSNPASKRAEFMESSNDHNSSSKEAFTSKLVNAEIISALEQNFKSGGQSIVLVNRRGSAHYLFSLEEKKAVGCPECSVSLTLYRQKDLLKCHYCGFSKTVSSFIKAANGKPFLRVGYGSEKVEEDLTKILLDAKIERLDADVLSEDRDQLQQILGRFRDGQIDILVGTQILAKGHDFPNVTLVVILDADEMMMLPDFRAGERLFQLLVQASGRAGRSEKLGEVIIQASRTDHPTILHALKHDFHSFYEREIAFRKAHAYPPFSRMGFIDLNSEDEKSLDGFCRTLGDKIESLFRSAPELSKQVRISGPSIPPLEMIRRRYRRVVLISAVHSLALHDFVKTLLPILSSAPASLRTKIDIDPQSVM